jgi:hypothetical protein
MEHSNAVQDALMLVPDWKYQEKRKKRHVSKYAMMGHIEDALFNIRMPNS